MNIKVEWLDEFLARRFHEIYERLAPDYGYETRKETREFDNSSPNGRLMVAVCREIIKEFGITLESIKR